ncbi:MAG: SUMF1/EgtB/PvdO family nonheme iron enzyme [archaeon]
MKRSAAEIRDKLANIYSTIEFFETAEESSGRYKEKNIIILRYTIPTGEERILKYFSLEHYEENDKEKEKNLIFDEYRIVSRFADHDNVVRVYEANELYDNNELIGVYYTMERFSATLQDVINSKRSFTDEEVWNFLVQMDSVLQISHYKLESPFIHSDIKPANIGVREIPKGIMFVLMDFDVSVDLKRNADGQTFSLSNRAMMKGFTPSYASPEQVLANLHGEGNISNRVDIYAIGVIAMEMITGIAPQKNPEAIYYDLPVNMLPDRWSDVINPLIHHDAKQRVKTIQEALNMNTSVNANTYQASRNNDYSFTSGATLSNTTASQTYNGATTNAYKARSTLLYSLMGVLVVLVLFLLYQQNMFGNIFGGLTNSEGSRENAFVEMVLVQGGEFMMGCDDCGAAASPEHKVMLDDFYIGKHEVTQAQWEKIMGYNPSYFQKDKNAPVENVSWNEVQEFIKKLNNKYGESYRLPTEAEWEYAAKGGELRRTFSFSGSNDINQVGWYDGNSNDHTHPVGEKTNNDLGISDMSGNVWEWCDDFYNETYYAKSPEKNPCNQTMGKKRVLRGGSYSSKAQNCWNSKRGKDFPNNKSKNTGFRLVKEVL